MLRDCRECLDESSLILYRRVHSGAGAYFASGRIHANKGSVSTSDTIRARVKEAFAETCSESIDDIMYNETVAQFWLRYNYMKANSKLCCRHKAKQH